MKTYSTIFKIKLQEQLHYKGSYISGVLCQIGFGFMHILLYLAFFENGVPQDFSVSQMVTYVWLTQAFFAMFHYGDSCKKHISNEIVSGNVCYQLIKPINLYNLWLAEVWFTGISMALVRCIPLLLFASILPGGYGLVLPVSILAFVLFLLSLILGSLLIAVIKMFAYILVLYTLDPRGVFNITYSLFGFLAGLVIPIPLFPSNIQRAFDFLPFRYVGDLPYKIYIGYISIPTALWQIAIQIVWIVSLFVIGKLILNQKSKELVVQGG